MLLFNRKSPKPGSDEQNSKAARFMADRILWCQTKFANAMSKMERNATPRQKKIALLFFIGAMATIYLVHLYIGITSPHSSYPIHQEHINIPRDIALPDSIAINKMKQLQEWSMQHDSIHEK